MSGDRRISLDSRRGTLPEQMKQTPMYQSYVRVAPRTQDWPVLCTKLGMMFRQDYDWSADVAKIKSPVLLTFGDADAVRTANAVQFFELLGGGRRDGGWDQSGVSNARLAILPGTTHYTIFPSPLLAAVVTQFLEAPLRPSSERQMFPSSGGSWPSHSRKAYVPHLPIRQIEGALRLPPQAPGFRGPAE
jgi:pimeloyl-ACP methyl ester carboxylesterase